MKSIDERKHRLSLTLLFAGIIFLILFITVAASSGLILLADHYNLFSLREGLFSTERILLNTALWSLLLGSVFSFLAVRILLKPVNGIINAMNALANGHFETRLSFSGFLRNHPTAVEISRSFNHMAQELEKTEMLRSDFINNFSHEFKTPIVSIAGFADLILEENLHEDEKLEYIRIISEEAHRLSDMATNVLSLTKVENQTILTDVRKFNLSEQIRSCLLLLESKWDEKALEIHADFPEVEYTGNPELLKQVWVNLIDNAVKFADRCGTIRIDISQSGDAIMVSIADTGAEIPEDSLNRIFQKFYQVDKSHATQGNGIGLSVAKAIVELHGGRITASSGNGETIVCVELPNK